MKLQKQRKLAQLPLYRQQILTKQKAVIKLGFFNCKNFIKSHCYENEKSSYSQGINMDI